MFKDPVESKEKEAQGDADGRDAELDEAMAQDFKEHMMDIPWVTAAARAAKRQEKGRQKKEKKEKKSAG